MKSIIKSICVLLPGLFIWSPVLGADDDQANTLKPVDIFELEYADGPRISPDGRRVIYERHSMDIMTDSVRSNLWSINIDGSDHRPLLSGRAGYFSPRWSPDGSRIAYISTAEGSPQLYVRWLDTGQTALLSNLTESPSSISWSPDGRWLAFTMHVDAASEPLAAPPTKPDGAEWAPPVKVVDDLIYRFDGQGYIEAGFTHVFLISAEGGTPRQLTQGDYNHDGPLSWTPDSRHIVFSANRNKDWEYQPQVTSVYRISLDDGILEQLTDREGSDFQAVVSPNGRLIAFLGFDDELKSFIPNRLYVMNSDATNRREIALGLDRSVDNIQWAGNNTIYFTFDDHGIRKLARTTLSGDYTVVAEQIGGSTLGRPYTSGSYTVADNGVFATALTSVHRPADLATGNRRGDVVMLTELNNDLLGHKQLGELRELSWQSSHDQLEIQGWIITPPGFDPANKYPLILEIHGGPHTAYGPAFAAEIQLFAAAGYVVFYTNPRGSTSYGEAFASYIDHNYPGNDYDDLMSGIDRMLEEGYIDTDNMYVTGGSGGGVLTAWIVGKTDRFRAAVVAKPVINWTSFVLTADFTSYFYKYWFSEYPWDDQESYWQRSPLSLVGNVKTPTLLLTGEDDYRTPISESEQYYMALKLRRVDTAMVRIPGASHGIAARPSNLIAKVDNILAWFGKYRTDLQANDMKD